MELFYEKQITVEAYNQLRIEVKWGALQPEQAKEGPFLGTHSGICDRKRIVVP